MLKTQKIKIEEYEFEIKELSTNSALSLTRIDDKEKVTKRVLELSLSKPEPTKELFDELPARVGLELMKKINELNGFGEGFPTAPEVLPKKKNGK